MSVRNAWFSVSHSGINLKLGIFEYECYPLKCGYLGICNGLDASYISPAPGETIAKHFMISKYSVYVYN